MGFVEPMDQRKVVHRHSVVNEKGVAVMRFDDSHHSTELQKSRYILIDTDEERLKPLAYM